MLQPNGTTLSEVEETVLGEIDKNLGAGRPYAGAAYERLAGKTDDQLWEVVHREVRTARFQTNKSEFPVGIACEERDLDGAKALAELIGEQGIPAHYPSFDTAKGFVEKLRPSDATMTRAGR